MNINEQNLSFAEQYKANEPLRQAAYKKHYEHIKKFIEFDDAQNYKPKGYTVLKVTPLTNESEFFILHKFNYKENKYLGTGAIIGMWNELTIM